MKYFLFSVFNIIWVSLCFAEENGFSHWWQSEGIIDSTQMEELNDLSGDSELWCVLAELYAGRELAEEADCVFMAEPSPTRKRGKKMWNVNAKEGSNLDSNGNFINKFAKLSGKAQSFSGEAGISEKNGIKGSASFRNGIFYAKGGDLTNKYKGILSEFNINDLKLGGEWLHREEKDSSWIFGRYSKNFLGKSVYAGGNFRIIAPYSNGNRLWSRSWQGVRYGNWNFKLTEIAILKENENSLDFTWLAERKKKGARLAFEHDKNKSRISAGFKPVIKGTDSLWARADNPLSMRIGFDKKMDNVKISNSFYVKKNWTKDKPLEYRSESKIKIPLAFSPSLTFRWTAYVYKNGKLNLRQFYMENSFGF